MILPCSDRAAQGCGPSVLYRRTWMGLVGTRAWYNAPLSATMVTESVATHTYFPASAHHGEP